MNTIVIGVCGAGTMGSGIAQVAAQSGFDTILFDVNKKILEKAKDFILKNLLFLVNKNKITPGEKEAIFKKIKFTNDIRDCSAFVIIEAIVEMKDAKISLFNELAKYNNEEVIFATNTSSLSVSDIQEKIPFPQRVIGMHFFNPAYIMKLVEVVKGRETNDEVANAIAQRIELATKLVEIALNQVAEMVAHPTIGFKFIGMGGFMQRNPQAEVMIINTQTLLHAGNIWLNKIKHAWLGLRRKQTEIVLT